MSGDAFVGIIIIFVIALFALVIGLANAEEDRKKKAREAAHTFAPSGATPPGFSAIADTYTTFEEVRRALRAAGLERSNLIVAIDFTKSNEWTGQRTFAGKCLHHIAPDWSSLVQSGQTATFNGQTQLNPYQRAIAALGPVLEDVGGDKPTLAFGFGDSMTSNRTVMPFFPDRPCQGFREVLDRYATLVPHLQLSGPTSFAPIVNEAVRIAQQTKDYHILVIIADGQMTDAEATRQAIVRASNYALSIIVVGVGDGPWDEMEEYDDELPERRFDNFQFVDFETIMRKYDGCPSRFAAEVLQEVPEQFKAIKRLRLL